MGTPDRRRVLVVGEALVDVVVAPGRPRVAHVGGSPLNVAVGLGRLGVSTTFAAQVGRDADGERVVRHLAESGVVLEALRPHLERTSTAVAELAADGSAAYEFDVTWDPSGLPDVATYDALHLGSVSTVLRPGADRVVELAAAARERGVPVTFDPNVRLAVEPDADAWRRALAAVLPHATVVKLSDEDASVLLPGVPPPEVAARLAAGGRLAVVTAGGRGAHAATPSAQVHVAAPVTEVVDTIGAGDSFMAATVAWLSRHGWPAADGLSAGELRGLGGFASAAAALTCSRAGADLPWAAELAP